MVTEIKTEEFGPLLKSLRLASGFGLTRFAEMIGVAPSYLSDLEHGRRPVPRDTPMLATIAEKLGLLRGNPYWERYWNAARAR